jgi:hypothetical protein
MNFARAVLLILSALAFTDAFSPLDSKTMSIARPFGVASPVTLFATEDAKEDKEPPQEAAAPPAPRSPPVPPPKRLDPLMATLTRMDPQPESSKTANLPFFGEVDVDGSLVVLIPVAVIAIGGFILSIIVAVNSQDQIMDQINQVTDSVTKTAVQKVNQQYDPNECRGLCSNQQQDLDGLRSFMDGLKK